MNRVQDVDLLALAPVLALATTMMLVLVVQAALPVAARGRRMLLDLVALGGVALGGSALVVQALQPAGTEVRRTFCTVAPERTQGASGQVFENITSACSYVMSPLTFGLQAAVLISAAVCLLLALDGPGAGGRLNRTEHHALLLAATTGALALAGARDLATLVVALETASLPVVGMVALRRDPDGAQAAMKLLLVAVTSFALLVLGVALLYAGTGTLHLEQMAAVTADPAGLGDRAPLVALGAAFAVAGIGYKVAALPFGLWAPDVYAGSPVPVAAFLSTVSKVAGLAGVALVLVVGLNGVVADWSPWLAVLVALTMTVGNLVAFVQRSAVRLLAWSTIAQAGWVLLPLVGLVPGGLVAAGAPLRATVVYLLAYTTATLVVFTVVVLVTRHHRSGADHLLEDYRGLARREPVAAAVLGLGLLSLAGLPPGVAGLVAKVAVIGPVVDAGLWWLAVLAALNVALGLAYYLRWVALLVARPVAAPSVDGAPQPGAEVSVDLAVDLAAEPRAAGAQVLTAQAAPAGLTWSVTWAEGLALGVSGSLLAAFSLVPQLMVSLAG